MGTRKSTEYLKSIGLPAEATVKEYRNIVHNLNEANATIAAQAALIDRCYTPLSTMFNIVDTVARMMVTDSGGVEIEIDANGELRAEARALLAELAAK